MSDRLHRMLEAFREGSVTREEVVQRITRHPFEEHLLGRFDHLREERTGIPEVILAEGKSTEELRDFFEDYLEREERAFATRVTRAVADGIGWPRDGLVYDEQARILSTGEPAVDPELPTVLVVSAGTADGPVAREAAVSSRLLGNPAQEVSDVGVAGIGRLTPELSRLDEAGIVIVVAGMDGVLPSLVASLSRQPVIGVPTSTGYGASLGGLSALTTMLNSCVPGLAVMNVDNGFGAACLATKINGLVRQNLNLSE